LDYLGKIPLSDGHALILGDMPLQTFIWASRGQVPQIVRVYYADPDANVIKILEAGSNLDFSNPAETLDIEVRSTPMMVFDSAFPGKDVGSEHLSIDLSPGIYSVVTKPFEPDDRTSVLVHKFVPQ
jgi:hypothetical protein